MLFGLVASEDAGAGVACADRLGGAEDWVRASGTRAGSSVLSVGSGRRSVVATGSLGADEALAKRGTSWCGVEPFRLDKPFWSAAGCNDTTEPLA